MPNETEQPAQEKTSGVRDAETADRLSIDQRIVLMVFPAKTIMTFREIIDEVRRWHPHASYDDVDCRLSALGIKKILFEKTTVEGVRVYQLANDIRKKIRRKLRQAIEANPSANIEDAIAEIISRGDADNGTTVAFEPTNAPPGSPEKVAVFEFRIKHGLPLTHPDDLISQQRAKGNRSEE